MSAALGVPVAATRRAPLAWLVEHRRNAGKLVDEILERAAAIRRLMVVVEAGAREFVGDSIAQRVALVGRQTSLTRDQIISHHNATLANLAVEGVTLSVLPSAEVNFG